MGRLAGVYAALALCLALMGGAIWLRVSLAREFTRGESHGRMAAALEARVAADDRRAELDALRNGVEREAIAIDREAEEMKDRVHDLEMLDRASSGGSVCLDAGLVRALDAIGRSRRSGDGP